MKVQKAYKFRIYPSKSQTKKLNHTLGLCRELYNASLQERRDAYKMQGVSLNYYDQASQLPAIKADRQDIAGVHSQVLQDVLRRSDKAFQNFFRRVKQGQKAGYPRFQGRDRYDSFTYPQGGWSIKNNRLTLSKIGTIKVKLHRDVIGKVKTCTIKRDGSHWFVSFAVEYEIEVVTSNGKPSVGIDVGLEHFANLSNGVQIDNPRYFRKSEKQLAKAQRKASKLKHLPHFDKAKVKAKRVVQICHRKVRNQRLDFHHKLSHQLVNDYSLVAVEDLNIKGLAASMLAKSVNDVGWSSFISMLDYKAVEAGSKLIKVDPRQTSQICPECGSTHKKDLSERWHSCPCGCEMHRDTAAALVILGRGLASIGSILRSPTTLVGGE